NVAWRSQGCWSFDDRRESGRYLEGPERRLADHREIYCRGIATSPLTAPLDRYFLSRWASSWSVERSVSWESWLLRDLATRSVMALRSRWAPPSGSGITSSAI